MEPELTSEESSNLRHALSNWLLALVHAWCHLGTVICYAPAWVTALVATSWTLLRSIYQYCATIPLRWAAQKPMGWPNRTLEQRAAPPWA